MQKALGLNDRRVERQSSSSFRRLRGVEGKAVDLHARLVDSTLLSRNTKPLSFNVAAEVSAIAWIKEANNMAKTG